MIIPPSDPSPAIHVKGTNVWPTNCTPVAACYTAQHRGLLRQVAVVEVIQSQHEPPHMQHTKPQIKHSFWNPKASKMKVLHHPNMGYNPLKMKVVGSHGTVDGRNPAITSWWVLNSLLSNHFLQRSHHVSHEKKKKRTRPYFPLKYWLVL